jgi:hypothetical protein
LTRPGALVPVVATAVGGVVAVTGSLLPWFRAGFPQRPETSYAVELRLGWFAVAGAGVLLLSGVLLFGPLAPSTRRAVAVVAVAAGVASALVAAYNLATRDQQVDDAIRDAVGETTGQQITDEQLGLARRALDIAGVEFSYQLGVYLTLAGGLVGATGGAFAVSDRRT